MVAKQHRLAYRLQYTGALILKMKYKTQVCVLYHIWYWLRANQNQGQQTLLSIATEIYRNDCRHFGSIGSL